MRDHKKNVGAEGWVGAVSKTTDGGQTWEMVYHTAAYYFNAISCADEDNCIAVAEGDYAVGFHTSDGGKTWNKMITGAGIACGHRSGTGGLVLADAYGG